MYISNNKNIITLFACIIDIQIEIIKKITNKIN